MSDSNVSDLNEHIINRYNVFHHGGDVYRNPVLIDYSVNLNPLDVPAEVISAAVSGIDEIRQYPDPYQTELRQAIASYEKIDPEMIICGNGASEIIMAAVHAFMPSKVLVTAPCYAGYEIALRAARAEVFYYYLKEENGFALDEGIFDLLSDDIDMVFLADPNNPNGTLIDRELRERLITRCVELGIVLVLDECFLPLTGRSYHAGEQASGTVLHLRAFTKTLALPGLRIGYMISGNITALDKIRIHMPEWNVSRIAEKAGKAAAEVLAGTDYLSASVTFIDQEREYLTRELSSVGIRVYPSDANYLLLRTEHCMYDKLLSHGILVRKCNDYIGLDDRYIRIAVRGHEDNEKLISIIKECMDAD